jgi:hypothetical protein
MDLNVDANIAEMIARILYISRNKLRTHRRYLLVMNKASDRIQSGQIVDAKYNL